jgi:hypothetical protein
MTEWLREMVLRTAALRRSCRRSVRIPRINALVLRLLGCALRDRRWRLRAVALARCARVRALCMGVEADGFRIG